MSTTDRFEIVRFRDQPLLCLERGEGIWVAMRPVVEGMGLDWKTQYRKLAGRAELFCVVIMTTQIPGDDQRREHAFIPLERLFGWLMTVSHTKVAPDLRERVLAYQKECCGVLARHFMAELRVEAEAAHDQARALVSGWFNRYPRWREIWLGRALGESRAETAARLGCAPDTITRNLRRMRAAGVLH